MADERPPAPLAAALLPLQREGALGARLQGGPAPPPLAGRRAAHPPARAARRVAARRRCCSRRGDDRRHHRDRRRARAAQPRSAPLSRHRDRSQGGAGARGPLRRELGPEIRSAHLHALAAGPAGDGAADHPGPAGAHGAPATPSVRWSGRAVRRGSGPTTRGRAARARATVAAIDLIESELETATTWSATASASPTSPPRPCSSRWSRRRSLPTSCPSAWPDEWEEFRALARRPSRLPWVAGDVLPPPRQVGRGQRRLIPIASGLAIVARA